MISAADSADRSAKEARRGTQIAASALEANRQSANAAQSASVTGTRSLKQTKRALEVDQRPWFRFDVTVEKDKPFTRFVIDSFGSTTVRLQSSILS